MVKMIHNSKRHVLQMFKHGSPAHEADGQSKDSPASIFFNRVNGAQLRNTNYFTPLQASHEVY